MRPEIDRIIVNGVTSNSIFNIYNFCPRASRWVREHRARSSINGNFPQITVHDQSDHPIAVLGKNQERKILVCDLYSCIHPSTKDCLILFRIVSQLVQVHTGIIEVLGWRSIGRTVRKALIHERTRILQPVDTSEPGATDGEIKNLTAINLQYMKRTIF